MKYFLERTKLLGYYRCERRRGSGQGNHIMCNGAPRHTCIFVLHTPERPRIHRIKQRKT
jgi:hypothetical protein